MSAQLRARAGPWPCGRRCSRAARGRVRAGCSGPPGRTFPVRGHRTGSCACRRVDLWVVAAVRTQGARSEGQGEKLFVGDGLYLGSDPAPGALIDVLAAQSGGVRGDLRREPVVHTASETVPGLAVQHSAQVHNRVRPPDLDLDLGRLQSGGTRLDTWGCNRNRSGSRAWRVTSVGF